jgi:hypothetical protein
MSLYIHGGRTMANPKITLDDIMDAVNRDDGTGFCLACRAEVQGVEPDARRDECDECGALKVYGAEAWLLRLVG